MIMTNTSLKIEIDNLHSCAFSLVLLRNNHNMVTQCFKQVMVLDNCCGPNDLKSEIPL